MTSVPAAALGLTPVSGARAGARVRVRQTVSGGKVFVIPRAKPFIRGLVQNSELPTPRTASDTESVHARWESRTQTQKRRPNPCQGGRRN